MKTSADKTKIPGASASEAEGSYGQAKSTRKAPRFVFSLLFFWLLAICLPAEVYDLARMGGQECSKPDPIAGFMHLENKKIIWKQEGFSQGTTNSVGFLDREHSITKPPGVLRIAMLGDSQTESLQVPQDCRFSNLLEQKLNADKEGRYEVLNCGISAAGTGQEYLTYLRYVEQYKPDITMLFFDSGDEDKNQRKAAASIWYPHVVFGLNKNQLTVSWRDFDSWLHSAQAMPIVLFEDLRRSSRLWGTILQEFNGIKSNLFFTTGCTYLDRWKLLTPIEHLLVKCFPVISFGPAAFKTTEDQLHAKRNAFCAEHGLQCADSAGESTPVFDRTEYEFGREAEYHTLHLTKEQMAKLELQYRQRWQLTLAILKRLSDECKHNGSKLIIVGFPAQLLKEGFGHTFTQVTTLANEQNFYAVDLTPEFDATALARKCEPRYVTHLTPAGHEVMANLLVAYLKTHQLVGNASGGANSGSKDN